MCVSPFLEHPHLFRSFGAGVWQAAACVSSLVPTKRKAQRNPLVQSSHGWGGGEGGERREGGVCAVCGCGVGRRAGGGGGRSLCLTTLLAGVRDVTVHQSDERHPKGRAVRTGA